MNLSTCATATAAMILSLQLKNHFDSLALLHPVGNGPFRSTQDHSSKKTNLQQYCRSSVDSRINLQLVEPISPSSTTPCKPRLKQQQLYNSSNQLQQPRPAVHMQLLQERETDDQKYFFINNTLPKKETTKLEILQTSSSQCNKTDSNVIAAKLLKFLTNLLKER